MLPPQGSLPDLLYMFSLHCVPLFQSIFQGLSTYVCVHLFHTSLSGAKIASPQTFIHPFPDLPVFSRAQNGPKESLHSAASLAAGQWDVCRSDGCPF